MDQSDPKGSPLQRTVALNVQRVRPRRVILREGLLTLLNSSVHCPLNRLDMHNNSIEVVARCVNVLGLHFLPSPEDLYLQTGAPFASAVLSRFFF